MVWENTICIRPYPHNRYKFVIKFKKHKCAFRMIRKNSHWRSYVYYTRRFTGKIKRTTTKVFKRTYQLEYIAVQVYKLIQKKYKYCECSIGANVLWTISDFWLPTSTPRNVDTEFSDHVTITIPCRPVRESKAWSQNHW